MNQVTLELGKILRTVGMCWLIGISIISWTQSGSGEHRSKNLITCDGESSDTIIIAQERLRVRILFEVMTKLGAITSGVKTCYIAPPPVSLLPLKSLVINAYQRNVFYVYAPSTVP